MVSSVSAEGREPFSMTNRGLSIKFNITPWSADTYLAYLDCAKQLSLSQQIRVGIFLRRLTEDDQYVRVNFSSKGLWLDTAGIYHRDDRPRWQRQLFVRQKLDQNRETDCLEKRAYGFKILNDSLPLSPGVTTYRFSAQDRVVLLRHGEWGCVTVMDVSAQHEGLRTIALCSRRFVLVGNDKSMHKLVSLYGSGSVFLPDLSSQYFTAWATFSLEISLHEIPPRLKLTQSINSSDA